jgi:hypothetical protein
MPICGTCFQPKTSEEMTIFVDKKGNQHCRCKLCSNKKSKIYNKTKKGKVNSFKTKLKNQYGLTQQNFEEMLIRQNFLCAICKSKMEPPCVDHDHNTNEIRGLLCSNCNTAIGMFEDSVKILKSAIHYLENGVNEPNWLDV